jgi:hypothetical protein
MSGKCCIEIVWNLCIEVVDPSISIFIGEG